MAAIANYRDKLLQAAPERMISDNILTVEEKPSWINKYATILGEQESMNTESTKYGFPAQREAYNTAISNLTTYLASLTTPVPWNNVTNLTMLSTTSGGGAVFRDKFLAVDTAKFNINLAVSNLPVVTGAKVITMSATSQIFKISKQAAVDPANIVFNATLNNLNAPVIWSVISGTATLTSISGTTATLKYTDMASDTATIKVTDITGVYFDVITIIKVKEGVDAIYGYLTNESCTVTADKDGVVSSYSEVKGSFKVYFGAQDVTTSCVFQVIYNPEGLLPATSINSTGQYSITSGFSNSSNNASVTYRASYTNPFGAVVSVDKVFSLSKSRAGDDAKIITLNSDSQVFKISKNAVVDISEITLTATTRGLATSLVWTVTSGTATITNKVGLSATLRYTDMGTDSVSIKVSDTSGVYYDIITIIKVREGIDAIYGYLTNESTTLAADKDGVIISYAGASGTFKVYYGSQDVTTSCTFVVASNPDGLNPVNSINSVGVYTINGSFANASNNASVTYRAFYTNAFGAVITIDKVFSLSKSKAGENAKLINLSSDSQVFKISKNAVVDISQINLSASLNGLTAPITWTVTSGTATLTSISGTAAVLKYTDMSTDSITIKAADTTGIFFDNITIIKVREGADAIYGYLTNEAYAVVSDKDGVVISYVGASGDFKVYYGSLDVTATCTFSTLSNPNSLTPANSISTNGSYAITGGFANATTNASVTYRASYVNPFGTTVTVDKVFSLVKSRVGQDGVNGTRGSQILYIYGTVWSDAAADAATTGANVLGDTVTISDGVSFVSVKTWNGSAWVVLGTVIDGSLIVNGTVTASKINSNGLSIRDAQGNVILSAGVPIESKYLNVGGISGNMLSNSGPAPNTLGSYKITAWNTPSVAVLAPSFGDFQPTGAGGVYAKTTNSDTVAVNQYILVAGVDQTGAELKYVVSPEVRYEVSIYVSAHRCSGALQVLFMSSTDSLISAVSGTTISTAVTGPLVNWSNNRSYLFFTPPANTAYILIRNNMLGTGGTDPYMFLSMQYLGVATEGQTVLTPWSDGTGATFGSNIYGKITPSNVGTYIDNATIKLANIDKASINNLSALSADLGSITAGSLNINGGRLVIDASGNISINGVNSGSGYMTITNSVIRVYDGAGTLRVRLGIW